MKFFILILILVIGISYQHKSQMLNKKKNDYKQDEIDLNDFKNQLSIIDGLFVHLQNSDSFQTMRFHELDEPLLPNSQENFDPSSFKYEDPGLPSNELKQEDNQGEQQAKTAEMKTFDDKTSESTAKVQEIKGFDQNVKSDQVVKESQKQNVQSDNISSHQQDIIDKEIQSNQQFQQNSLIGPKGIPCVNEQDCHEKNNQFYKQLRDKLKGADGANGDKGPKGPKGLQGPKGKTGPKGIDGVPFSKDYLEQLAKHVAQEEILKSAQDEIENIAVLDNDAFLEQIYYTPGGNNCNLERKQYIKECKANEVEICLPHQSELCCPKQSCAKALDDMFCCFNRKKAPEFQIEKWDADLGASWMDILQIVNQRQEQAKTEHGVTQVKNILERFEIRQEACTSAFSSYKQICPLEIDE